VNAIDQAQKAYAPAHSHLRSAKSIEYQVFSDVIGRLQEASDSNKFSDLVASLYENRALWSILARDVANPDNGLPQQLRAQIFYLYEFTQLHTGKVLRGDADVDALIDINTSILRGLASSIHRQVTAEEMN